MKKKRFIPRFGDLRLNFRNQWDDMIDKGKDGPVKITRPPKENRPS